MIGIIWTIIFLTTMFEVFILSLFFCIRNLILNYFCRIMWYSWKGSYPEVLFSLTLPARDSLFISKGSKSCIGSWSFPGSGRWLSASQRFCVSYEQTVPALFLTCFKYVCVVKMVSEVIVSSEQRTGLLAACVLQKLAPVSPDPFHVALGIEEFMQKGRYLLRNSVSSARIHETGIPIP